MKNEIFLNTIELGQASFGETPEGFDTVDVDTFMGKRLRFIDPDMFVISDGNQAVIGFPVVRNDDTIGTDFPGDDGKKFLS